MISRETAKEMAKYIALGVSHPENNTTEKKMNVTLDILNTYNVIEKDKAKVFGQNNNTSMDLETDEDLSL